MLSKVSIKRPVTTVMVMLIAALAGVVALMGLNLDLLPNVTVPMAIVQTTYVGAGPEEIESLVTKPIEGALGTVSNVDTITSTSSENSSMVLVQFLDGTDVDMAAIDMREKVDMIKSALPESANDPMIIKMDPAMLSTIMIGVNGQNMEMRELTTFLDENVTNRIERIEGVASVSVVGGVENEVEIILQPEKMQGYQVTTSQISGLLQAENMNLPTGTIRQGDTKMQLRSVGEFKSVEEIQNLPLMTPAGALIHLYDVAEVKEVAKDEESYALINGEKSLILTIQKQSNSNVVDVSDKINKELDKIVKEYPQLQVTMLTTTADYIKTSVSNVLSTALQAALMAMVVLFLFLRSGKSSLIIGVSIPFSVVVTFALMYLCGMTLNIISLGGITIGIGMLVDNSVVVLESIMRHHEKGEDARKAAFTGASEVAMSVTASTLTTVAVFFPMMFVTGIIGQVFKDLSLTVSFSLIMSLITSLTFVPMAASRLLRHEDEENLEKHPRLAKFLNFWKRGLDALDRGYSRLLRVSLRHKKRVIAVVFAVFFGTLALLPVAGFDLFPTMDQGEATVTVEMPKGAPITETAKVVDQVTEKLQGIPEMETWYVLAGSSTMGSAATDTATFGLNLVGRNERSRSTEQVIDDLKKELKNIPGAKITASASTSAMGSFASGSDIQFQLNGSDTQTLRAVSEDLMQKIEAQPWASDATSSMADSVPQANIRINRAKASAYGITAGSIASTVSLAVTGSVPTQYKMNGEEIDIRIMQDQDQTRYINDLESLTVPSAAGLPVPLSEIADITVEQGTVEITRTNQHRYITIGATTHGVDASTAKRNLTELLDSYHFPEGYDYQFTGTLDSLTETFSNLLIVLIVAVLLVYMIMAAQFESFLHPLIIMFSLPLAITGGILGLVITGNTITTPSFMGFIMLVGMVVNNAIVLVDYTNQLVKRGLPCDEALAQAGSTRLRPILMTTLTTVLGLIPMAVAATEGTEMQQPLAIAVMFGLTLSTLVTLVFIPVLYSGVDKFRRGRKKAVKKAEYREGLHGEAELQEEIVVHV